MLNLDHTGNLTLYKHKGCPKCYNTGYKGRVALFEILEIDKELDDLIFREASRKEMLSYLDNNMNYKNLSSDAVMRILEGITDIEEAIKSVDMSQRLKNVNILL